MDRLARVAVAGVLVAGVLLAGVYYDAAEDRHDPYPEEERLATDYLSHVGQQALLFGTVERVDADRETATITVESDEGPFRLTVRAFDARVEPGGTVQVYGELRPDRTVAAERVVVVNPTGGSAAVKYAVSAVGAALVVAVFLRHWRVDLRTLTVEAR